MATDTVTGTLLMLSVTVLGALGRVTESESPGGTAVSMFRSPADGGAVTGDAGLRPARSAF